MAISKGQTWFGGEHYTNKQRGRIALFIFGGFETNKETPIELCIQPGVNPANNLEPIEFQVDSAELRRIADLLYNAADYADRLLLPEDEQALTKAVKLLTEPTITTGDN